MQTISQSTQVQETVADIRERLCAPAPLLALSKDSSTLHYHAPRKVLKAGESIRYHMVYGLLRIQWSAKIVESSDSYIRTKLVNGPMDRFFGFHSWEESDSGTLIRDELQFETDSESLNDVLENLVISYGFELDAANASKQETGKFRTWGQNAG